MSIDCKEDILHRLEHFPDRPSYEIDEETKLHLNQVAKDRDVLHGGNAPTTFDDVAPTQTIEVNRVGIAGEWAFAQHYDLPLADDAKRIDGDEGYDFFVTDRRGNPLRIDVKTITHHGGDLLVPTHQDGDTDLYFLCEKRGDVVGLIGWTMKTAAQYEDKAGEKFPADSWRVPRSTLASPFPRDFLKPRPS